MPKATLELSSSSNKLSQDINFLLERLTLMQAQSTPNKRVLSTYQNMLDYRLDVLAELLGVCQKSDQLQVIPLALNNFGAPH